MGLIVAKVSGEPFGQFLEDRIFKPLHMSDTLAYRNGKNTVPNRAYGHSAKAGEFLEGDQSSTSATLGDGGVYSNLADLAKWDAALQNHTLLGKEEMNAALTPVKLAGGGQPHWPSTPGGDNLNPGKPVAYGFGWFLDPYRGRRPHVAHRQHAGIPHGDRTLPGRQAYGHRTLQSHRPGRRRIGAASGGRPSEIVELSFYAACEAAIACPRSHIRSSTSSMPTEMRTRSLLTPASNCCPSLSCWCVVDAG